MSFYADLLLFSVTIADQAKQTSAGAGQLTSREEGEKQAQEIRQ